MLWQLLKEMSPPTPALASTYAGTQYTKYTKSLLHKESLAILLTINFCYGWLERAVSPGRDSYRCWGDRGPFQMGGRGDVYQPGHGQTLHSSWLVFLRHCGHPTG